MSLSLHHYRFGHRRFREGPWSRIGLVIVNLLAGSLLGASQGANWVTRTRPQLLYRVITVLLVAIALILLFGHDATRHGALLVTAVMQVTLSVIAGFASGKVAALMGVAGGELLVPTLVLLFGIDIKLAGSLSLVVNNADNAHGVCALQPGPQLCRPGTEPGGRGPDGGRLDWGRVCGRPVARLGLQRCSAASSRSDSGVVLSSVKVWQHG
ncbi:TSUP family transporter [Paraburkholderia sp. GAS334]|uniref:TSUP family transporter n=1 Tax=Paraburkholderia sp. GAS334 TaxID=3035131 RepID=UPI003D216BEE